MACAIGSACCLSLHSAVTSHARMIWQPSSTLAWALPQQSEPLLAVFMIDKSGSVKLVWAFSAGVSTIGPGADDDASSRCVAAGLRLPRDAAVRRQPRLRLGFQSLHRRFDRRQAVLRPTQFLGQLIPTPRTQDRILFRIDVLGLLEQLIDLGPQLGDFLGHVAITIALCREALPWTLVLSMAIVPRRTKPAAFARQRTCTNTSAKASR